MDTQAEVLSPAEGQQALDGPIPHEVVGIGVLPLVAVGRCEQRDDSLTRLIVVPWMVNGLRTVRANHCAGAQYRIISSRATGTLASKSARTAASWSGRLPSSHSPCATIFGTVSVPPMNTPSIWVAASMSLNAEPSGNR